MKNITKKLNIFVFFGGLSLFAGLFLAVPKADAFSSVNVGNPGLCALYPLTCVTTDGNSGSGGNQTQNLNVETSSATNIGNFSATLRGEIVNMPSGSYERYFQWGTSSGNLNNTLFVSGTTSSTGNFSRTLDGLNSGQTYYFRACAQRTTGNPTSCGSVRSFTTNSSSGGSGGGSYTYYNPADVSAVTTTATGVSNNFATLNGISMINQGGAGEVWFEYGLSTALGIQTQKQNVSTGTNNVSRQISGLVPGVTYYYRVVVQNSRGTVAGEIRFFTTTGAVATTPTTTPTTPRPTTPAPAAPAPTITNQINSVTFLGLEIESNLEKVMVGDVVTFTVSYKNVSGKDLKNVTMRVELPREMTFRKTTMGDFYRASNSVLVSIANLPKDAKGNFIVIAEVLKEAANQSIIVASLEGVHDHPTIEGANVNSINYAILEVERSMNLTASTFSLGEFFPGTFIGWLLIALIILMIILIARKIAKDKEEREEEKLAEEGIKIAR